jgi:hypothetical protein
MKLFRRIEQSVEPAKLWHLKLGSLVADALLLEGFQGLNNKL